MDARPPRRAVFLAATAAAVSLYPTPARADTAYFSFQGAFSTTTGASQNFNFTLPTVAGNNPLTLKTFAYSGGTNAASQSIAPGGIDSVLTLFNASNTQIAQNDDANPAPAFGSRDSLLSPTGTGTSLLANQSAGNFRLALTNFSANFGDGHWAADIVNAATAVNTTLTATSGTNSTLSSLAFGATGAASTATFNITGGSPVSVAGDINTGTTGNGTANLNVSGTGSSLNQTGATNLRVGSTSGSATLAIGVSAAGGTVSTGSNGLTVAANGSVLVGSATTVGTLNVNGPLTLLGGGTGALVADGAGSSVAVTGATSLGWNSGNTNVTFKNGATGSFPGGLKLVENLLAGTVVNFAVLSGATLTAGPLRIANATSTPLAPHAATLTVSDPGSSLTLTPSSTLVIGDTFGDVATLTVANGATLTVGAGGSTTLHPASTINILGATVDLKSLTDLGGTINFTAGSLSLTGNLNIGPSGPLGQDLSLPASRHLSITTNTTVSPFCTLTLSGGSLTTATFTNNGTFNFDAGTLTLTGAAGLTIGTGGALGPTPSLGAGRTIKVNSGTTVASTGILYLTGGALSAFGGLTNAGEINLLDPTSQLTGGTLTNNKLITGNGRISNNLTNSSTGEVRATGASRLTFAGGTNSNAGRINLVNGGTVEFTGPLTNSATGVITGRGALFTSSLTNAGQLQISAGLTDIYGPVTTSSGGKILVSGAGTATFYNAVTLNTGSEFRVSAGSTAVFFGAVTGTGQFTGTGTKHFESGASAPDFLATQGSTIVESPASLTTTYLIESSLTSYGLTSLLPNSPQSTLSTLDLSTTGTLDLANNTLLLTPPSGVVASATTQIRQYLFNNQLFSSVSDPTNTHSLGYLQTPSGTLIQLTLTGDANLDGTLTADDFALLDRGLLTSGSLWQHGDFNYDGQITPADHLLLDSTYAKQQGGLLSPSFLSQRQSQFGPAYVSELLTSIPEPTLPSILYPLSSLLLLLPRHRRG